MENQFITVIGPDGIEKEAEVLTVLTNEETQKDFILYTFNEIDENNSSSIYASILIDNDDSEEYVFETITDPSEWEMVQEKIKEILDKK